ncbi:MAG TPA: hypothetical protein VMK05_05205 [Burkholderiales bacterium]|nr:hypothetical protein [Burkholderiales bacterium]
MTAQGLITVWLHVEAEHEDEFNDWYNLEHLAQIAGLPGVVCGRRYAAEDAPIKYLAWYDTVDDKVETGAAFQGAIAHPTPWSQRMRKLFGDRRERFNFRLAHAVGDAPARDAPWLYLVHTDIPDDLAGEYNDWYDREHLPRLITVPGVLRARRYVAASGGPKYLTAYELADENAFESPEGLKARKTPWTEKMRAAFQNTRRRMCRLVHPTLRGSAAS